MHIPKSATSSISIQPFKVALDDAIVQSHIRYSVEDWLYVPNHYDEYRYILGTRGKKPLICIGINPSTAEPGNLDPTLKSVQRIAESNGFDSFIMLNVYPQRATRPEDMENELNEALHEQNLLALDYSLSISVRPVIWAAWGNIIDTRDYLIGCVKDMADVAAKYSAKWKSAGSISKKGNPHHPLYLKSSTLLDDFDIDKYFLSR